MIGLRTILLAGLAATGVSANMIELVKRAGGGTCNGPDFVNVTMVGPPPPYLCESDWGKGYLPITNLTFWSDHYYITGFQVTYSDGSISDVIGQTAKQQVKKIGLNYGQGDKFTKVEVYGHQNLTGSKTYSVVLETIKGGKLSSGRLPSSSIRHVQAPGIGILFGLKYSLTSDGAIAALGFVLLEPAITEIQITDIQFPNGPVGASDNIYPRSIGKAHFYNNASEPQTYHFSNTVDLMQSYTFTEAITLTFTVMEAIEFDFTYMLLGVGPGGSGKSTTTFVWTATSTTTFSSTNSETTTVGYSLDVTLATGKGVDCTAIVGQGKGTYFYTSLVTLSLKNGNSYTFPENGYVTVQSVSEGIATCTDANHP